MANQIQATVYQIDGNPLTAPLTVSFLTSDILIRENSISTISVVASSITIYPNSSNLLQEQTFFVSESISTLLAAANTNGTTLIQATILEINGDPQVPSGVQYCFPANAGSIWASVNAITGVNSFLTFKNKNYSASETEATLVAAANAGGGGGGGGTNPTSLYIPYNNAGTFADSYIINDTFNNNLKTTNASILGDIGLSLDFQNDNYFLGDYAEKNYGIFLNVDDFNGYVRTHYSGNFTGLLIDFTQNIYKLGDYDFLTNNGTSLIIDDNLSKIYTQSNSTQLGLNLDFVSGQYWIGDATSIDYQAFAVFNGGIGAGSTEIQFVSRDLILAQELTINTNGTTGIIKTVYNAVEEGIYLDCTTTKYFFKGAINNEFGIEDSSDSLWVTGNIMNSDPHITPAGFLRINANGVTKYIPMFQ